MLSCSCSEPDLSEPGNWAFYYPEDFSILASKRSKRCASCRKLVKPGTECLKFERIRGPNTDIEERISGYEIPMAPLYQCQECGEIFLNLNAAGYCLLPTDDMRESMREYWKDTGFDPERYRD